MRYTRIALLTVAALVVGTIVATAQEGASGPKLTVPERTMDFGTVPQGEVLTANFKLVNEGTKVLQVKGVRPTCGCTVAEFDHEIQPDKEGWVKAKLDTTGFAGPISKSILIVTDDPTTPTSSVIIKADVKPYLEALPRPLLRFNAIQGETSSQTVTVVADQPDAFKVTGVESDAPFVSGAVRKLGKDELIRGKHDDQYEVTVNLAPDAPVGPINATLTVLTTHPKAPKLQLKVYGVVRALIHVTPPELQFGAVEAALKPGRNVIVINNQPDTEMEVTGAEVNDPAFTTEVITIEKGKRYQVSVTVKADATPGPRDAVLTIRTTDAAHSQLTVPVRASIQ